MHGSIEESTSKIGVVSIGWLVGYDLHAASCVFSVAFCRFLSLFAFWCFVCSLYCLLIGPIRCRFVRQAIANLSINQSTKPTRYNRSRHVGDGY